MKTLFLLLFVLTGYCSFSQGFILEKRSKIKHKMEKFYAENNRKYSFTETDSTITFILNDSLTLPLTNVFYFNERNRCIKQEDIFSCDSCLQQSMQVSLSNKFTNWDKTGPDSYYAGFPYNRLMEKITDNGLFILRFTQMKRKEAEKNISQQ